MSVNIADRLASYVDALHPIIYINHFDFNVIDKLIGRISNNIKVFEYNNAEGLVDFITKTPLNSATLEGFLGNISAEAYERQIYIVLKDIHRELSNPKIISKLRSIAERNLYLEGFYATIFIVSNEVFIPAEIENYITIFDISMPDRKEIIQIVKKFAGDLNININEEIIEEISLSFKGLNEFQITRILNLAYQDGGYIDRNDKHLILQEKEQIIKKSGMVEIVNFKETIEDIGGLENLKKWVSKKAILFKSLDKAIKFGVDIPKGIMIIGMPGCGKSLTAKAISSLFEVPLLRLDVGRLMGKYVGESELNLRKALKITEAVSPCVLWVDEIEKAFAGVGGEGGASDVTTRLFGNFLTWIQEKESTVFIVATANDISKLPAEFLRKGRFDELFFVDLPTDEERRKIFEIHIKKRNKWNRDIDIIKLIKETEGFSGADIEGVVKETIENAFIDKRERIITDDLMAVVKETKSISTTLKEKLDKIREARTKLDIKPASTISPKDIEKCQNTGEKSEDKKISLEEFLLEEDIEEGVV